MEVMYDQTSTYRTSDPDRYDGVYVATRPFAARWDSEAYTAALRALSPRYEGVSTVEVASVADGLARPLALVHAGHAEGAQAPEQR